MDAAIKVTLSTNQRRTRWCGQRTAYYFEGRCDREHILEVISRRSIIGTTSIAIIRGKRELVQMPVRICEYFGGKEGRHPTPTGRGSESSIRKKPSRGSGGTPGGGGGRHSRIDMQPLDQALDRRHLPRAEGQGGKKTLPIRNSILARRRKKTRGAIGSSRNWKRSRSLYGDARRNAVEGRSRPEILMAGLIADEQVAGDGLSHSGYLSGRRFPLNACQPAAAGRGRKRRHERRGTTGKKDFFRRESLIASPRMPIHPHLHQTRAGFIYGSKVL